MALTQDQILGFAQKAKQAGFSDSEIAAEIKRKNEEEAAKTAPPATQSGMNLQNPGFAGTQTITPPTEEPKSMTKKIGEGVIGFGKSILSPFQGLAADAYDIGTAAKGKIQGKENLGFGTNYQNPFRTEKKLEEVRNQNDKTGFVVDQAKKTAGIASFAVPFGKAGFAGSKAIVPGMAAGGLNEASQDDASVESVVGASAVGGALGLGGQLVGKVVNKIRGGKNAGAGMLEKQAQKIEEDTRKIRVRPSVYGASQEKNINKTLDRLEIKGSAQDQYEKLQPAMDQLETEIQDVIKKNPGITVKVSDIQTAFKDKLKSALRSKDFDSKTATTEVNGYLKDLMKASGGTGKVKEIDLQGLRELKKLINEDYGQVHSLMERGMPLTPRQKVIAESWSALDDAIKTASPEIKALLTDESNLYKAASSLSSARTNPPTFRIAGTSIPAQLTQKARDMAAGTMRGVSRATDAAASATPNIPPTVAAQAAIRMTNPNDVVSPEEGEDNQQNYNNNEVTNDNVQPTNNITQPEVPATVTGRTVDEHLAALSAATRAGDTNAAKAIKAQLEIEQEFAKSGDADAGQKEAMMANAQINLNNMKALYGVGTKDTLSQGKSTVGFSGLFSRAGRETQKLTDQEYVDRMTTYKNMTSFATGLLNQARGAGVLNDGEYTVMSQNMPNEYSSEKQAKDWFSNMEALLKKMDSKAMQTPAQIQATVGGFAKTQ